MNGTGTTGTNRGFSRMDSPLATKIARAVASAHVGVFKLTNGRIGSKFRVGAGFKKPVPTLLLEHTGRKSGTVFTAPVLFLTDGANLVIAGSKGGMPKNPQWVANLKANPDTRVHLRGERARLVRARVATPEEKAALWPRLVDMFADYAKYQAGTDRDIPVIILEPR